MQKPTIYPIGATHYSHGYGEEVNFYKKTEYPVLNNVSEEWQTRTKWHYWNAQESRWVLEGAGFCDRRLESI